MSEKLFQDVKKLLSYIEGMPYSDARILLVTALEVLEKNCYLDLTNFIAEKEVAKNGK